MAPIVKNLPSGLRLVVVPQPEAATVTALVLVGTGSTYEHKSQNGLSHFLEHMCFKATTRRPNAKVIAEELDRLGAVSNAFTSHEYTGYYAKGNPKHLSTFLDVLSDIYLHSTFPDAEIQKEKGVIIEEINMYEDLLQHKVGEELLSVMYGDQPAGWPIIGLKETVLSFDRDDFVSYKKAHYHAENTVVVVVGPVDADIVADYVTANFAGIDTNTSCQKEKTVVITDGLRVRVVHRSVPQAHIALGFHSVPFRHPDSAAVSLLTTMLGRGMSSRLFQKLREELGAAYYVHAEQEAFIDHGIFGIAAGIDKDRLGAIFEAIAGELRSFKKDLIDERELAKAKEYTLGMLRLGFETTDDIAAFYGMPLVLKKDIKTLEEIIDEYLAVSTEDIQRVANELFVSNALSIAVIGPYQESDIPLEAFKEL